MKKERQKVALISVFHKEGIEEFARGLVDLGWKILSSGGTCDYLNDNGIEAQDVAEIIGGGKILGRKVITISREIHAMLLADFIGNDAKEMEKLGLGYVSLMCGDFYTLLKEIMRKGSTPESITKEIDIGGPTMIKSAAKGNRIAICDPDDRGKVLRYLERDGDIPEVFRNHLRAKAFFVVSKYYAPPAEYFGNGRYKIIHGQKAWEIAYAENRNQSPAFVLSTGSGDPLGLDKFRVISGNPGYVNMCGLNRGVELISLMADAFRKNFNGSVPYITIACKHGNPCGIGVDWESTRKSITRALGGDRQAVMGGEGVVNFPVEEDDAKCLRFVDPEIRKWIKRKAWGLDFVAAPSFTDKAKEILGKKKGRRLLDNVALLNPTMPKGQMIRMVRGGFLMQQQPDFVLKIESDDIEWVNKHKLNTAKQFNYYTELISTLIIAWAAAWRANSNSIAIANGYALIGRGFGQQSRNRAADLAIRTAKSGGHDLGCSVFASDAFFFLTTRKRMNEIYEAPEALFMAGCSTGITMADGKNLDGVKEYFLKKDITVGFLPKEFRGFSQH